MKIQESQHSVNPVDVKIRANMQPDSGPRILGFDAAGIVKAVGSDVTRFKTGDEVCYAGGVGSILIQLANKLTGLNVIATASRADTQAWVKKMGADHVVNHRNPLAEEMTSLGISPRYVAALTNMDEHS